jgi:uncharacterized damage-inducible protein DinB
MASATVRMTKAKLLDEIQTSRAEWDALLSQIDKSMMTEPGVEGAWSLKDIIAHVGWGEREVADTMYSRVLGGSDLWNLRQNERNAAVFEMYKDQPLDQVIEEEQQAYQRLVDGIKSLSDEEVTDPSRFKDMPDDWEPWVIVAQNTYEHYPDHIKPICEWLAKTKS